MKFESVEIERYGRVRGLETGDETLPSLVVVWGPNESGKSTFFSFLTTLLYGFKPAAAEKHPYAPWDGGRPEGRARIRLDDGGTMELHRLLASTGRGSATADGRAIELGNRPLPSAQHVSREVFRQVYAISLPDLTALKNESWARVQDRLTGAMGASDLRPARVVAAEFDRDASALWRPDKRGRPQARALLEELRELADRRQEALESDRELRQLAAQCAEGDERLAAVREEQKAEEERRGVLEERLVRLRDVAQTLARIEELRVQSGGGTVLEDMPAEPATALAELRSRRQQAEERIAELDGKTTELRERIRTYQEQHRPTAEAESQVRQVVQLINALPEMERQAATAEGEAADETQRWNERARGFFSAQWREWDEATVGALQAVQVAELGSRVEACRNLVQRRRSIEEAVDSELAGLRDAQQPSWWRLAVGGAMAEVGGTAAVALGFFRDSLPSWLGFLTGFDQRVVVGVCAVVAGVGTILVVTWYQDRRKAKRREKQAAAAKRRGESRIRGVEEKAKAARQQVAALTEGLPVLPERLAAPDSGLAAGVERAASDADALIERERAAVERRRQLEEARAEIKRLPEGVGSPANENANALPDANTQAVPDANAQALPDASALLASLESALQAREEAGAAQREIDRAEAEQSIAIRERDEAGKALQRLESRLAPLGDDDPDRGAEAAAGMLDARDRADRLAEELRQRHPDLDELWPEHLVAEPPTSPEEEAQQALDVSLGKLGELKKEAESLQAEAARLETELRHVQERETADSVASRIAEVEDRIRDAKRRRDRAFLLARLVEKADRRFREENQPELLRHAGEHLRAVTRGRYDRIQLGEDEDDPTLFLRGPAEPAPRMVEGSLSQGTKEQVYLALRLAIVDRLDDREETLPLFMDEVLVNWDAGRRDRVLDLLERVSQKRQIFFFTCHPALAAELEDRGGTILPLDA